MKLPKLQAVSESVWRDKYALPGEDSPAETFMRVAKALSDVEETPALREEWFIRFLWAMNSGAFPAGRILSNAGAWEHKPATSTINCTVSGTIHDSMDDILRKVHEAGLTLKAGCGIGYDFSTLRPRGAYVSGAGAYTSGPLSFMDIYDKMCFTVSSAGGRRGAQMGVLDIRHPDVLEFIRAKREAGRLRQFNLSLLITQEFMEAVEADAAWQLIFPASYTEVATLPPSSIVYAPWPVTDDYATDAQGRVACKVYTTVAARELWRSIMEATYEYAEPGFILIDQVNGMNNNWWCEDIRASNPCVPGETWVHTADGPRQVCDLVGKPFVARVDGKEYASGDEGFFKTATRQVLRLQTQEGYSLRLTANHQVRCVTRQTREGTQTEWREAGRLQAGDRLLLQDHRTYPEWSGAYRYEDGYLLGLLIGDGTMTAEKAVLAIWSPQVVNGVPISVDGTQDLMQHALECALSLPHRADFKGWRKIPARDEHRLILASITELAKQLGIAHGHKTITPAMEKTSSAFQRGLLRGLFDTDGSVQGSQQKGVSVRLSQSDRGILQAVQRMLLRLGIFSRIYCERRPAGFHLLPNGKGGKAEYPVKAWHELVISNSSLAVFAEQVGFADSRKQQRLETSLGQYQRALNKTQFTAVLSEVQAEGVEDVYDVRIPGINTFDADGFHAHNCGEQMLPPYGSCLLGSVNLAAMVHDPWTEDAWFDWPRYEKVVAVFTRMLDNVVEINGLPLKSQQHELLHKRRHGMGYFGLGSALTLLGMRYGSPEAVQFTRRVTKSLALTGWKTAVTLGKEKGAAPLLQQSFIITEAMLRARPEMVRDGWRVGQAVKGKDLHSRYSRYMQRIAEEDALLAAQLTQGDGARFTHHTSIAPTGTLALSFGNNASNGIEPTFAHQYVRNIIRPGRKTKESVEVLSYELLMYRECVDPHADAEDLPAWCSTTDTLTPQDHIAMQAAAQEWVDSAISKTINVPSDTDFEAFQDVYRLAYEQKLKGCATFRFNPEAFQGVLVRPDDLAKTSYTFTTTAGVVTTAKGDDLIQYDGETHTAANLYDALKEGYYAKL